MIGFWLLSRHREKQILKAYSVFFGRVFLTKLVYLTGFTGIFK